MTQASRDEDDRAPAVPHRAVSHEKSGARTGTGNEDGPRPSLLVRGHSSAEAVGFEPTVTLPPRQYRSCLLGKGASPAQR